MVLAGGPSLVIIFKTKVYIRSSELLLTDFVAIFQVAYFKI